MRRWWHWVAAVGVVATAALAQERMGPVSGAVVDKALECYIAEGAEPTAEDRDILEEFSGELTRGVGPLLGDGCSEGEGEASGCAEKVPGLACAEMGEQLAGGLPQGPPAPWADAFATAIKNKVLACYDEERGISGDGGAASARDAGAARSAVDAGLPAARSAGPARVEGDAGPPVTGDGGAPASGDGGPPAPRDGGTQLSRDGGLPAADGGVPDRDGGTGPDGGAAKSGTESDEAEQLERLERFRVHMAQALTLLTAKGECRIDPEGEAQCRAALLAMPCAALAAVLTPEAAELIQSLTENCEHFIDCSADLDEIEKR